MALKMSVTRSASARTLEWVEQAFEENERKELELEMEKRKEEHKDKLMEYEETLDMELINSSDELKEVYAYYQVIYTWKYCCWQPSISYHLFDSINAYLYARLKVYQCVFEISHLQGLMDVKTRSIISYFIIFRTLKRKCRIIKITTKQHSKALKNLKINLGNLWEI